MKGASSLRLRPYEAYQHAGVEWLGTVPAHWDVRRIKTVLGNVVERPSDTEKVDLFVGMENVESWTGRLIEIDPAKRFDSQCKAFDTGDILFGKLRPYLAKVVRADRHGVCVGEFLVLRRASERAHEEYLELLLRSEPVISEANSRTFGARMPRTNWLFVGGTKIPLPPRTEQDAIARFLDLLDDRIRRLVKAKEKLLGLLEELRVSTIAEAVTGQINVCTGQSYPAYKPSNIAWLDRVPSHWQIVRGKYLWACVDVRSATGEEELLTVSSERGVLPRSTTSVTMFKAASYVGHKLCWPGDLVVNSLWAWAGGLGVSDYHGIVSTAYGVYRLHSSCQQNIEFLHELLRSRPFEHELRMRSKGIWTSRLQLTDTAFLESSIALPPLAEQMAIFEYLTTTTSKIDTALANTRREIELLQEYRTRVIADVVTGKVDVREAVNRLEDTAA